MTLNVLIIIGLVIIVALVFTLIIIGVMEVCKGIFAWRDNRANAKERAIYEMILREIYKREMEIILGEERMRGLPNMLNTTFGRERLKVILKEEREKQWRSIASKREQEPKEILLKNSQGMDIHVDGQCSIAVKSKRGKPTL